MHLSRAAMRLAAARFTVGPTAVAGSAHLNGRMSSSQKSRSVSAVSTCSKVYTTAGRKKPASFSQPVSTAVHGSRDGTPMRKTSSAGAQKVTKSRP